MKTILKVLFVLLLVFKATPTNAKNKIHLHIDNNFLAGMYEQTIRSYFDQIYGFDFNISTMYDLSNHFSVGAGVGVELQRPVYCNTLLPIFGRVEYRPFTSKKDFYAFTRLGYAIKTNASNPGYLFNPGIGYKVSLAENFSLNFMLGYHLQTMEYEDYEYPSRGETRHTYRRSISIGVGLIFF